MLRADYTVRNALREADEATALALDDFRDLEQDAEGHAAWALEQAIADCVARIREDRRRLWSHGKPNQSERDMQREEFNRVLRPYGFRVSSIPNWRGSRHD